MKKKYYVYKMNQSDEEYSDGQSTSLLSKKEKVKQSCTDIFGLFVLGLSLVMWLIVTYDGLINSYRNYSPSEKRPSLFYALLVKDFVYEYSYFYGLFILPTVFYLWLYLMAVRFLTKFTIIITILLTTIFWIVAFYVMISINEVYPMLFVFLILVGFVTNAVLYCTLMEVKIDNVIQVIQDSCRAMMCTPSFLIIVILQMCITILTALATTEVITYNVFMTVQKNNLSCSSNSCKVPVAECLLILLYTLFSLWLLGIIHNFGQMVLYKTFTTWYRTENKQSIPYGVPLTCAFSHIRYHMGTISFGSTFFTILPIVVSIFKTSRNKKSNVPKPSTFAILVCLPSILGNATTNALIACAAHGTNFYASAKHSFKTILQDPVMFTTTRLVTFWMILFGLVIIPLLTITTPLIMNYYGLSCSDDFYGFIGVIPICYVIVGIISLFIVAIFLNGLNAAIYTILFCSLEDLENSELPNCSNYEIVQTKRRPSTHIEEATENDFLQ